jgi:hypothetical protein
MNPLEDLQAFLDDPPTLAQLYQGFEPIMPRPEHQRIERERLLCRLRALCAMMDLVAAEARHHFQRHHRTEIEHLTKEFKDTEDQLAKL